MWYTVGVSVITLRVKQIGAEHFVAIDVYSLHVTKSIVGGIRSNLRVIINLIDGEFHGLTGLRICQSKGSGS